MIDYLSSVNKKIWQVLKKNTVIKKIPTRLN